MIQTNNLTYGYVKHQPVLKEISLALPAGHIYGLFGKNGVGKSTFLKLLSGTLLGQGDYSVGGLDPRKREPGFQEQIRLVPDILENDGRGGRKARTGIRRLSPKQGIEGRSA